VCFVPGTDHAAFLEERAPHLARTGEVVDADGRVLARHGGTFRFTVGQRKGLGVSTGERAYVVEIDSGANRVVVGPAALLSRRGLEGDRVSWVEGAPPSGGPFEAEVQIRYRGPAVPAVVEPMPDGVRVEFRTPQRAVAPGQSAVLFRGDEVLGGARIVRALA
jgi:tRNA-specific 2-thiouridylase